MSAGTKRFGGHRPPLQIPDFDIKTLGVEGWAFSALMTSRVRRAERDNGWVAQLAEQWTENPRVGGSIPPPATPLRTESAVERRKDGAGMKRLRRCACALIGSRY